MTKKTIQLCNSALTECEMLVSREFAEEVSDYINKYNEWGVGIELLIDVLMEEDKKISIAQFNAVDAAMESMGLSESPRIKQLKTQIQEQLLTETEAYLAMYSFLEEYYKLTNSDEIGGLLGSMSLLQDGGSADPEILGEWKEAVDRVLKGKVNGVNGQQK